MQINGIDFKELLNKRVLRSEFVSGLSRQLSDYEKRVKNVVHEIDLKSREAREKSKKRLDVFADQVKKTRVDLEKRVVTVVNQEAQRLNKGLNELVGYLKGLSAAEQGKTKKSAKKSTNSKKKKTKKSSGKKVMASKKSGTKVSLSSSAESSLTN